MPPSHVSGPRLAHTRDLPLVAAVAALCTGTMVAGLMTEPASSMVQHAAPIVRPAPLEHRIDCVDAGWRLGSVPTRERFSSLMVRCARPPHAQALTPAAPVSRSG